MLTIIYKTLRHNLEKKILNIFRFIGHQNWIREGLRVKFIRMFYDYEKIKSIIFEIDYFGNKFSGNLNSFIDWRVFFLGGYEMQELILLASIIKKRSSPVFIDIGANIGTHSLFMSKYCAKIYAFEPDNEIKNCLDFNIIRNKIKNIITIQKALSSSNSSTDFYSPIGANKGTGSLNYDHDPINNLNVKKVDVVIGDFYLNELKINKIDLIKLDVEGHEIEAINGLKETINRFRPILLIEISKKSIKRIKTENYFISFLINKYSIFELKSNEPLMLIFNKPKAKLFDYNWEEIYKEETNLVCFPNQHNINL